MQTNKSDTDDNTCNVKTNYKHAPWDSSTLLLKRKCSCQKMQDWAPIDYVVSRVLHRCR